MNVKSLLDDQIIEEIEISGNNSEVESKDGKIKKINVKGSNATVKFNQTTQPQFKLINRGHNFKKYWCQAGTGTETGTGTGTQGKLTEQGPEPVCEEL